MSKPTLNNRPLLWKRGADLRDEKGFYSHPKDEKLKYPSVTKIIEAGGANEFIWVDRAAVEKLVKLLEQKRLDGESHEVWRFDPETGKYAYVSENPATLLRDGDYISKAGLRDMKRAADRGSTIHDLFEDFGKGAVPTADQLGEMLEEHIYGKQRACTVDECLPYAQSLLRWWDKNQPEVLLAEGSVFNEDHNYAGRLDAVLYLDGQMWVCDLKTSDTFRRPWMMQIAAYSKCAYSIVADPDTPHIYGQWEMPQGLPGFVLHVTPKAAYPRYIDRMEYRFEGFLSCLSAYYHLNHAPMPPRAERARKVAA